MGKCQQYFLHVISVFQVISIGVKHRDAFKDTYLFTTLLLFPLILEQQHVFYISNDGLFPPIWWLIKTLHPSAAASQPPL